MNVSGNSIQATGVDVTDALPAEILAAEPVVAVAVTTDGATTTIERVRTLLERAMPGSPAVTQADLDAKSERTVRNVQRISNLALTVTLVIAGCSLAVAVAGSIVERRQPFALLRLAGTRLSDLRRVVMAEAAAPLLIVATATVAIGLAVTALTLATDDHASFALPDLGYWLALVGGLAVALGVVAATLPLLNRLTSPESVRIE
jgi:predicted lysophospholipase L1 biosynthesis ABC-type transport system permease subunit